MKKILLTVAVVLFGASGLLYWGSSFATNMVHDQLTDQHISFGAKESLEKEGEPQEILQYAGQPVDSGPKAKAYSDYIKGHLKKVAGGKTYSEVSGEFLKDTKNTTLAGQRQTLFMGETLRGLLLNAWGWGLVGSIALYSSIAVFVVGVGVFLFAAQMGAPKKAASPKVVSSAKKKASKK